MESRFWPNQESTNNCTDFIHMDNRMQKLGEYPNMMGTDGELPKIPLYLQ